MAQLGYTTTDEVRAVLGVSETELEDKMMLDLGIEIQLNIILATVYSGHAALKAKIDDNTATAEEVVIWNKLQMYVRYESACRLLPQWQMVVAKRISDGDFDQTRFGPDDLAQFREEIRGSRDGWLISIDPEASAASGIPIGIFSAVSPDFDPVTNEAPV